MIKSFKDLPREGWFQPPAPQWVEWDGRDMAKQITEQAARTLTQWLDARMLDLIRERVTLEEVQVLHHGNRTIIRVGGKDRFEFKLKITMGGT
jgi:hypothetical protein